MLVGCRSNLVWPELAYGMVRETLDHIVPFQTIKVLMWCTMIMDLVLTIFSIFISICHGTGRYASVWVSTHLGTPQYSLIWGTTRLVSARGWVSYQFPLGIVWYVLYWVVQDGTIDHGKTIDDSEFAAKCDWLQDCASIPWPSSNFGHDSVTTESYSWFQQLMDLSLTRI